jgi:PAS domain S-box-containing protein
MTSDSTKRKMFIIATGIFVITMSSVLFLVKENKLEIHNDDIKAYVLQEEDIKTNQTEAFYREMLENNKDDLLVLKDDTTVLLSSAKLAQNLGYSADEVKNQNFFSMVHPKDLPEVGNVFMGSSEDNFGPVRIRHTDGSYTPYIISMDSFTNDLGERISITLLLTDTSQAIGEIYAASFPEAVEVAEEPEVAAVVAAVEEPEVATVVAAVEEPEVATVVAAVEEPEVVTVVAAIEEPEVATVVAAVEEPEVVTVVAAIEEPEVVAAIIKNDDKNKDDKKDIRETRNTKPKDESSDKKSDKKDVRETRNTKPKK